MTTTVPDERTGELEPIPERPYPKRVIPRGGRGCST